MLTFWSPNNHNHLIIERSWFKSSQKANWSTLANKSSESRNPSSNYCKQKSKKSTCLFPHSRKPSPTPVNSVTAVSKRKLNWAATSPNPILSKASHTRSGNLSASGAKLNGNVPTTSNPYFHLFVNEFISIALFFYSMKIPNGQYTVKHYQALYNHLITGDLSTMAVKDLFAVATFFGHGKFQREKIKRNQTLYRKLLPVI